MYRLEGELVDGRYKLKKRISTDAYSADFLADEVFNDRLIREVHITIQEKPKDDRIDMVKICLNLNSPFSPRFFTVGNWNYSDFRFQYLISETMDESLDSYLERQKTIADEEAKQIITSGANALVYLHARHIVHRDVKPANIVRIGEVWKLTDFNIAYCLEGKSEDRTENTACTPLYAPPEIFESIVSTAMDVWALGITIIEMLTGAIPYSYKSKSSEELMQMVMAGNITIPDLPAPFDAIAKGCLIKDYKQRWTASDVIAALQ